MNEDLIAVITPSYNGLEFLDRVIKTVKNQTLKNIRHYIYDDFSTDDTKSFLLNFIGNSSVSVVYGSENCGQSHGRNCLIKEAIKDGCKYIAFLDVDDLWEVNHLETSLPYLNNYDFVYSKPKWVLEDNTPVVPLGIPVPKIFIGKHLRHNNFIWISSVVGKIENFNTVEFDSKLDSIEDWDMWLQQYRLGKTFIDKNIQTMTYLVRGSGQAGQGPKKYGYFEEKNNRIPYLKLNLASGKDYQEDYVNVDLYNSNTNLVDVQFDVRNIPYDDNTIDEIRAFQIIDHFDFFEGQQIIKEWLRVLKPGGRLWIETPDFLSSCQEFTESDSQGKINLYEHFFSTPWILGMSRKFLFTEEQLVSQLNWAGFKNIRRLPASGISVNKNNAHLFLNIEAFK